MAGLLQNTISTLSGIDWGKKVTVPGLQKINLGQIDADTKAATASTDQFSLEELKKSLDYLSPGSFDKVGSTIAAQLRGEVSPDDTRSVIRNATSAGFNLGVGGSQFGTNITARALYGSEAAAKQQGFQNLLAFQSRVPNNTSMFLSAPQRLAAATTERDDFFKRDLLANQIEAGQDPFSATGVKVIESL